MLNLPRSDDIVCTSVKFCDGCTTWDVALLCIVKDNLHPGRGDTDSCLKGISDTS